jgi:hypothetical protein
VYGRPQGLHQLFFAYEVLGIAHEAEERIECFGLERHNGAVPFQHTVARIQLEFPEPVGRLNRALILL